MPLMNRATFWAGVRPGMVDAAVGMSYKRFNPEWPYAFKTKKAPSQAYVESLVRAGLGPAFIKPEGQAFDEDAGGDVGIARCVFVTVGTRFRLTEEAQEDNQYEDLLAQYSREMGLAVREVEELICANVINNGTSASYPLWNGQPLFSTAHPIWSGGTFANVLATQSDLFESSLEDALLSIDTMVNDRQIPIPIKAVRLVGGTGIRFDAHRILNSVQRTGTNDNDINAVNDMGLFSEPPRIMRRLTNSKAWFLVTDAENGAIFWDRTPLTAPRQKEDDDYNYVVSCRRRFGVVVVDPRSLFAGSI